MTRRTSNSPLRTTASSPGDAGRRKSRLTLPPRQLAKARSRLAFLVLVFAGLCVIGMVIDKTLYRFSIYDLYPLYLFNGITSTTLYALTRIRGLADRTVLNFGVVYELLLCLSVSTAFTSVEYRNSGAPPTDVFAFVSMERTHSE